jgi:pyruvate/2-oxoglutarate dehydrogenase complex dihydrolipoamide acyltransferase (E2) component
MPRILDPKTLPSWRRLALVTWDAPRDPTAYGIMDLDCENALAYIAKTRAASGEKVTMTTLIGKCIAMGIAEHPETNAYVSRGNIVVRDTVDIFYQVSFFDEDTKKPAPENGEKLLEKPGEKPAEKKSKNANLAGAKIIEVNVKSVVELSRELRERAEAIRGRGDGDTARAAKALARVPQRLIGVATRFGAYASYDLGWNLSKFGIPFDAFGSCMVTNVGVFGIELAFAPLVDMSRVPIVLTVGAVRDAPSVFEGRIEIRKRLSLGIAFDHRIMDGFHAGKMAKKFSALFADPEKAGI